jgi:hypothetical protein
LVEGDEEIVQESSRASSSSQAVRERDFLSRRAVPQTTSTRPTTTSMRSCRPLPPSVAISGSQPRAGLARIGHFVRGRRLTRERRRGSGSYSLARGTHGGLRCFSLSLSLLTLSLAFQPTSSKDSEAWECSVTASRRRKGTTSTLKRRATTPQ